MNKQNDGKNAVTAVTAVTALILLGFLCYRNKKRPVTAVTAATRPDQVAPVTVPVTACYRKNVDAVTEKHQLNQGCYRCYRCYREKHNDLKNQYRNRRNRCYQAQHVWEGE